ncbi:lysine--tRNA ligase, partial [Bacillus pseudomycoides]|nr:lysine--tRNA ligase [Bacillus pseudomycoides]
DLGGLGGIEGKVFKTNVGELSVKATGFTLLTKALCRLPDKYNVWKDVEQRYLQRYLDLITSIESRATFVTLSKIIRE